MMPKQTEYSKTRTSKHCSLKNKNYLGDGVYCGHDEFQLWLYLSNGITEHSFIAMEPEALLALVNYMKNVGLIDREEKINK
jgi:hypothetical protein